MRIMYPHHPVSYIGQARRGGIAAAEDSADRGTHGPGHVITLRALVKGALCRWRYYVVVSEGDSGRVLWAQYIEIARYGELLRVTAEFSMPYAPWEHCQHKLHQWHGCASFTSIVFLG